MSEIRDRIEAYDHGDAGQDLCITEAWHDGDLIPRDDVEARIDAEKANDARIIHTLADRVDSLEKLLAGINSNIAAARQEGMEEATESIIALGEEGLEYPLDVNSDDWVLGFIEAKEMFVAAIRAEIKEQGE